MLIMKAFKKSVIAGGKSLYKYEYVTVPVFKQTDMKSLIQLFIKNFNEYAVCMQDKINAWKPILTWTNKLSLLYNRFLLLLNLKSIYPVSIFNLAKRCLK